MTPTVMLADVTLASEKLFKAPSEYSKYKIAAQEAATRPVDVAAGAASASDSATKTWRDYRIVGGCSSSRSSTPSALPWRA